MPRIKVFEFSLKTGFNGDITLVDLVESCVRFDNVSAFAESPSFNDVDNASLCDVLELTFASFLSFCGSEIACSS